METRQRSAKPKILLTSVFGPYGEDNDCGSRAINPMELYHNQVTRVQGPFSLRMFHRSFALLMLKENIDAPCTVLDFPTRKRFIAELDSSSYDLIGVSAIIPNIDKVKQMCALIRRHQPRAKIAVGGHIANLDELDRIIDADFIVRGEGIAWLRSYVGETEEAPIRHPAVTSAFGTRILGITLKDLPGSTAAIVVPSVGCPIGCNFCSTSALFGGKGNSINFYKTGDELFQVLLELEAKLKVRSFFILDENFLLFKSRAIRLLELIVLHRKSWSFSVFSSARVIRSYKIEELIRLGISWIWMGIEGTNSPYAKLSGVNTVELVKELQEHGIRVLGSSIIGFDDHSPANIDQVIAYSVRHNSVFHQFMLYTPVAGTELYRQHQAAGTLIASDEFPFADSHGQYRFNYNHPNFKNGEEGEALIRAFKEDFRVNGPSLARLIRALLNGWQRYHNHPNEQIRSRYIWEAAPLKTTYAGAVWAMRSHFKADPKLYRSLDTLLGDLYRSFGLTTKLLAPIIGLYIGQTIRREENRLAKGFSYEPRTWYEKNPAAEVGSLEKQPAWPDNRSLDHFAPIDPPSIDQRITANSRLNDSEERVQ